MNSLTQYNKGIFKTLLNEPFTFLGGLLFFLMIFSPAYNVIFKIILIAIILIGIITTRISFDSLSINWEVFIWYILFIGHGIFFSLVGFANHNNTSYILRTSTYNIIWPFIYLMFTLGIYKKQTLYFFVRVIVISNFAVSLYLIGSALTLFGFLPPNNIITFQMASIGGDTLQGLLKTQAPSVVCLLFTVPFVIALALLDKYNYFRFKKWFLYFSILLSIIAVISTARRALILNILLGLFFTILLTYATRFYNKTLFNISFAKIFIGGIVLLVSTFILIQQLGFLDIFLVYDKFLSAFAGNDADASTQVRYEQFHALVKSWLEKPFFGYGHGAVSQYDVRSEKTPWVYELSYMALLFQTGALGLITYLCLLFYPIVKGMLMLRSCSTEVSLYLIPCIVGCLCFLIANATNPYLISYDYMWTLFFPIAVINYFMKPAHE